MENCTFSTEEEKWGKTPQINALMWRDRNVPASKNNFRMDRKKSKESFSDKKCFHVKNVTLCNLRPGLHTARVSTLPAPAELLELLVILSTHEEQGLLWRRPAHSPFWAPFQLSSLLDWGYSMRGQKEFGSWISVNSSWVYCTSCCYNSQFWLWGE